MSPESGALIILAGLPGAGKSTWAERWPGEKWIGSPDAIRIANYKSLAAFWDADEATLKERQDDLFRIYHEGITAALRLGNVPVVIADATHLREQDRQAAVVAGAEGNVHEVHLVVFSSVKAAFGRNEERHGLDTYVPRLVVTHGAAPAASAACA